jgi:hypothetical protein
MECSRTKETIIENEYCDIFPNQVSMEKASLTKTMEENISLQTQSSAIQSEEQKLKQIYRTCICKEKNGKDMIGMHYVGHFSL